MFVPGEQHDIWFGTVDSHAQMRALLAKLADGRVYFAHNYGRINWFGQNGRIISELTHDCAICYGHVSGVNTE